MRHSGGHPGQDVGLDGFGRALGGVRRRTPGAALENDERQRSEG
jgi:hypothetical protein